MSSSSRRITTRRSYSNNSSRSNNSLSNNSNSGNAMPPAGVSKLYFRDEMSENTDMWSVGGSSFNSVSPSIDIEAFSKRLEDVLIEEEDGEDDDDDDDDGDETSDVDDANSEFDEETDSVQEFFDEEEEDVDEGEIFELYPSEEEEEDDKELLEVYPMQEHAPSPPTTVKTLLFPTGEQRRVSFRLEPQTLSAIAEQEHLEMVTSNICSSKVKDSRTTEVRMENVVTILREAITTASTTINHEDSSSCEPQLHFDKSSSSADDCTPLQQQQQQEQLDDDEDMQTLLLLRKESAYLHLLDDEVVANSSLEESLSDNDMLQQAASCESTSSAYSLNRPGSLSLDPGSHHSSVLTNSSATSSRYINYDYDFGYKLGRVLFGRESEVSQLRRAFDRVCSSKDAPSEIIHVRGMSGAGKTRLVSEALRDYATYHRKGCFVAGQFDQLRMNGPYSAIVEALQEWCDKTLRLEVGQVESVRNILNQESSNDLEVLKNFVPSSLLDTNKSGGATNADACQCAAVCRHFFKLKMLLRSLIRALSSTRPTVFFLDDVQWADASSRKLIQSLCSDAKSKNVLFVLACRDMDYHQFRVDLVKNHYINLETQSIVLSGLNGDDVNEMFSSLMDLSPRTTQQLTSILMRKTNGNINHIIQYLKVLQDEQILYLCNGGPTEGHWTWDVQQAEVTLGTVDELIFVQLFAQNPLMLSILKIAACIGSRFDLRLLRTLVGKHVRPDSASHSEIDAYLSLACRKGFVRKISQREYVFTHGRVQHCCYQLIEPEGEREWFHLQMGDTIWDEIKQERYPSDSMLFLAVDHLNQGSRMLSDLSKRKELADLNLQAGKLSEIKADFIKAVMYFRSGINLLEPHCMWTEDYRICVELHELLALNAHRIGQFDECSVTVLGVMENADTVVDSLDAAYIRLESLACRGELDDAIMLALELLAMIRFRFNDTANKVEMAYEALRARRFTKRRTDEDILNTTGSDSPRLSAAMKLLDYLATFAFFSRSKMKLFTMATLKMIQLSYKKALTPWSSNAFLWYGVLHAKLGNLDSAYRFCTLGRTLLSQMGSSEASAPALVAANQIVNHRRKPLAELSNDFRSAFDASLRCGCTILCAQTSLGRINTAFFSGGFHLQQVEEEARYVMHFMRDLGLNEKLRLVLPILQVSLCLQGNAKDPGSLSGKTMIGQRMMEEAMTEGDIAGLDLILVLRLLLAMSFEKWDLIQRLVEVPSTPKAVDSLHWSCSFNAFVRGMARFSLYRLTKKRKHLREGMKLTKSLQKYDAQSKFGCKGKHLLLKAEYASLKARNDADVFVAYDAAVQATIGSGESLFDKAMVNERAAFAFLERNETERAKAFVYQAIDDYSRWGAKAKASWLETMFHDLLVQSSACPAPTHASHSTVCCSEKNRLLDCNCSCNSSMSNNTAFPFASPQQSLRDLREATS